MTSAPSRRQFIHTAAAAAAGVTIVPRHVLGGVGYQAPSDTFNVAGVGVGGMGRSNLTALASQNIVALCDVDFGLVDRKYKDLDTQLAQARKQIADLKANPGAPAQGPGRNLTPEQRLRNAEQRAANVGVQGNREYNPGWHTALDLDNLLTVSEAIAVAAIERKESRGGHFRDDYPDKSAEYAKFNIVLKKAADGSMQLERRPIPPLPAELAAIIEEQKS